MAELHVPVKVRIRRRWAGTLAAWLLGLVRAEYRMGERGKWRPLPLNATLDIGVGDLPGEPPDPAVEGSEAVFEPLPEFDGTVERISTPKPRSAQGEGR